MHTYVWAPFTENVSRDFLIWTVKSKSIDEAFFSMPIFSSFWHIVLVRTLTSKQQVLLSLKKVAQWHENSINLSLISNRIAKNWMNVAPSNSRNNQFILRTIYLWIFNRNGTLCNESHGITDWLQFDRQVPWSTVKPRWKKQVMFKATEKIIHSMQLNRNSQIKR